MPTLAEIVYKITDTVLNIQPGNVVSVAAEIHNSSNTSNPLSELPFTEELATRIRKKKAFPVLEISTENLQKRFFSEMSDEIFSLPMDYYLKWIQDIDFFIEIGWKLSDPGTNEEREKYASVRRAADTIINKIVKAEKKILFLNFPTKQLAELINSNYEELLEVYLQLMNCNYFSLKMKAKDLSENVLIHNDIIINSGVEQLKITLKKQSIEVLDGSLGDQHILSLPAGVVSVELERHRLSGVFSASRVYYKHSVFNDVKISFENGNIRYISFPDDNDENKKVKEALEEASAYCLMKTGLNNSISEYTNFSVYDVCISDNISLCFFDENSNEIVLSNKKAYLEN